MSKYFLRFNKAVLSFNVFIKDARGHRVFVQAYADKSEAVQHAAEIKKLYHGQIEVTVEDGQDRGSLVSRPLISKSRKFVIKNVT